jgi:hypothetical protein
MGGGLTVDIGLGRDGLGASRFVYESGHATNNQEFVVIDDETCWHNSST